ncbi:Putative protein kinase [Colletotrichum destructivum]|uniref:Protein kinase domain-containing protein n=1 Tax=Colletotrichum destructivum TaxID=34406 RepID=A0AAX4IYY5_9PEZI|nr:Putative protein kinase [Colletotrichum destructivum]
MSSFKSQRKTWSCDSASPTTTISSHGVNIGRLSVKRDSARNTSIASSTSDSFQSRASYLGEDWMEVPPIEDTDDNQVHEGSNTLISDLEEDIEIIEDRGESLRAVQLLLESHAPEFKNSEHEELRAALLSARVKSYEGQNFIPTPTVERLLTAESVRWELGRSLPDNTSQELDGISRKICLRSGTDGESHQPGFLRVFATLILMNRPADIRRFMQSGISDDDLPLSESQLRQALDGENSSDKVPAVVDWSSKLIEEFQSLQWELCAPFFSGPNIASKVHFYRLDKNAILPFTTEELGDSAQETVGGYGVVHKVKIHNGHHGFSGESVWKAKTDSLQASTRSFAVKKLRNSDERYFAEELKALLRCSNGSRGHLVTPLAAFQRGETYNIIFEWADGGDLRQYWRANQSPRQFTPGFVHWVAEQCLGIATALGEIHTNTLAKSGTRKSSRSTIDYGRHGDLKPENVLWFHQPGSRGTLSIADFGLTTFGRSAGAQHRDKRHTPTYRAPEYDLNRGVTTQAYDIWSLGCVFLEFTTWLLIGSNGDARFSRARTTKGIGDLPDDGYFVIKRDEAAGSLRAEIKPSVSQPLVQWIDELRQHPNCITFLQRMLDIIETRMLLVDVEERIKALDCASALAEAALLIEPDSPNQLESRVSSSVVARESCYEIQDEDTRLATPLPRENGIRNLRLELLDTTSHRISTFDGLRWWVERQFGLKFDWFPLPLLDRRPASAKARLVWNVSFKHPQATGGILLTIMKYGGHDVSIFLSSHQLQRYRSRIRTCDPGILPTTNALQTSSSTASMKSTSLKSRWDSVGRSFSKTMQYWQKNNAAKCHTAATHAPSSLTAGSRKESYFCIDKHCTSIRQTSMYTVPSIDSLENDYQLFLALRESLTAARGSWLHRLSSWRTCTGVRLSKVTPKSACFAQNQFTFLFDNCDLVKAFEQEFNGNYREICKGYDYCCLPDLDPQEHMELMAETILQGLQEPERGRCGRAVLDGIPKLQSPPGINKRQYNSGWGFHTTQGYCLMKILLWVGVILSPGVVFALAWLSSVNALDLQNAFVPISLLAGLFTIMLAAVLMCTT